VPIDIASARDPFAHLVSPAYDDDEVIDYFQSHVALNTVTIQLQVLHPDMTIVDRGSLPLLVIAVLWGAFLAALGIAHWREYKGSKIVE
jgi:hypothetical protein